MSNNLTRAEEEAKRFYDSISYDRGQFETYVADTLLSQYVKDFTELLQKTIADRNIVSTGSLAKNIEVNELENGVEILMPDYWDYVNQGVKGVASTKNAPDSKYKFKNYGMNDEGRASIRNYISSGKAKIRNVKVAVKSEKRKKSLIDLQTDNLIYLIKKYGIKKTSYFTDSFNKVFANFQEEMAKAYGEDIKYNIQIVTKAK
jgi:hypothetical protein